MVVLSPFIWLTAIGLIYLAGMLLYSWGSALVIKALAINETVTFKRTFVYCISGALIGIVISIVVFHLFKATSFNGPYPDFNVKLLQRCCLLPIPAIFLMSLFSFRKQKMNGEMG